MSYHKFFFIFLFHFVFFVAYSQQTYTIKGKIIDDKTAEPLAFAHICNDVTQQCFVTNFEAEFVIENNLCNNEYAFSASYVGYETKRIVFTAQKDTQIIISLKQESFTISEVIVHQEHLKTESASEINIEDISLLAYKNIAQVLESVAGVSILKTGTGNAIPIVQGLYGNRVSVINHGLEQASQQWGNDHSPEIDPFSAQRITIYKGASSLAFAGNAIGGVIAIDEKNISLSSQWKANATYVFQSNGLGNILNAQLENYNKNISFRINGTLKRLGDHKAPLYYLTNTGRKEANVSLLLEKKWNTRLKSSLYYSFYSAQIGILRGAHIGNLTDLEEAIGRDEPFFTQNKFSYAIASPKQNVMHHLLKYEMKYLISENQYLNMKYGFQHNDRKEFDVRRSGMSQSPALSLKKQTHSLALEHYISIQKNVQLKTGLNYALSNNTNIAETGILPLIPDFLSHQGALYSILSTRFKKLEWNFGARYDLKHLYVLAISKNLPRRIEKENRWFNTFGIGSNLVYNWSEKWSTNIDINYVQRAPQVNELYSFGLHQGVSGIEEGDKKLKVEQSLKFLFSNEIKTNKLKVSQQTYLQRIYHFIYLEPQTDYRLTIRGAFPVFLYKQTEAMLVGSDFTVQYQPIIPLNFLVKYALVRGYDLSHKTPLIYMPADNVTGEISYTLKDYKRFEQNKIQVTGLYVFKQNHLNANQDFLATPKAYFLLGLSVSNHIHFEKSYIALQLGAENVLNQKYRDYLNRQRYYADELGVNLKFRIAYHF